MIDRTRRRLSRGACLVACLVAASAAPAAAAPAVAWQVKQGVDPTILPPGTADLAQYHLLVTNVGAGEAASGVTVTDTVSVGAVPLSSEGTPSFQVPGVGESACAAEGQVVTCEVGGTLLAGAQIDVYIPLTVEPHPPGIVTNEVVVSSPGTSPVTDVQQSQTGTGPSPFSLSEGPFGLSGSAFDEGGATPPAGAHPFDVQLSAHVTTVSGSSGKGASDPLRSLRFAFPAGLTANPLAVGERCTLTDIQESVAEAPIAACPAASQVGIAHFSILGGAEGLEAPLIDMVPPPGAAAEFALVIEGTVVHIRGGLTGDFRTTVSSDQLLAKFPISGLKVDFWGVPSDHRHDALREGSGLEPRCTNEGGCSVAPSPAPFLTMPTTCGGPMTLAATATGWLGGATSGSSVFEGLEGDPVVSLAGCNQLAFEPTIESKAGTNAAESPSGLELEIHQPQDESLAGRASAALKDAAVELPEGWTINPSAANGSAGCSMEQMGYAPEEGRISFSTLSQSCPNGARLGSAEISTPLIDHRLSGSIYLAEPFANPFGSLLAIYLALEDEESGVVVKLAGKVDADPATGRLTAAFAEAPQLPIEDIDLSFFGGTRGAFTTPLTCSGDAALSTLVPWSSPEGLDAHPAGSVGALAGCYGSEGAAPKAVDFTAGTLSPLAGGYTPFVLRFSRADATQHITGIETTLPVGLVGKLAGVPYCPESGIARATSREAPQKGKDEQASPSCPTSSRVGTVNVTAGSGIRPTPVSGDIYLAGPYKGAPFSLVAITPVVSGPFDLGTVVTRIALYVDASSAQLHAVADPLPTIRDGIPLDIRSIELLLDRSGFMVNPTSCEVTAIEGRVSTQAGQSIPLRNRFQVGECRRLDFKPKLSLKLSGAVGGHGHPALRAALRTDPSGAALRSATFALPSGELLDLHHLRRLCGRSEPVGQCPARSRLGSLRLESPLLEEPFEGPVYLRVPSRRLPDLAADVHSGGLSFVLSGRTTDSGGRLGVSLESLPDIPVSSAVLRLAGGRRGIIVNSHSLCGRQGSVAASFSAHNGRRRRDRALVRVSGCR